MPDPQPRQVAPSSEPVRRFHLKFPAQPHAVRDALRAALARFMRQLSEDEAGTLELILAELFNNIVEHGYKAGKAGSIALTIVSEDHNLFCTVSDCGLPLPAACMAHDDNRPDPALLPEGGFGWYLILDLAHDPHYRRDDDCNIFSFRLPFGIGSEDLAEAAKVNAVN